LALKMPLALSLSLIYDCSMSAQERTLKQIVYKYRLTDLVTKHMLPRDAKVVLVDDQRGIGASVWMKHSAEFTQEDCAEFTFFVIATGEPFEHEHVGSYIDLNDRLAWHITMQRPEPPIEILTKVEEAWFENFYECPECGHHWTDQWSSACDDECPECQAQNISPYESKDVG